MGFGTLLSASEPSLPHITHPFNGPLSGTTRMSHYQKGKTNMDSTEARDSEWQWHQLGHMQVCTSLQADNTPAPHHSFFTGPTNGVKALKAHILYLRQTIESDISDIINE